MKKVAIIDDDEIFQFTTRVKFQKLDLASEVLIFGDGEEAMYFLKDCIISDLPDILLLDINMPIVDGWDFLKLFGDLEVEKKEKIEIHMLSSSINPDDVKRAENNPFVSDYITKPIRDEDLTKIFHD